MPLDSVPQRFVVQEDRSGGDEFAPGTVPVVDEAVAIDFGLFRHLGPGGSVRLLVGIGRVVS